MKVMKIFASAGLICAILATSVGCKVTLTPGASSSETTTTASESEEPTTESTTEATTEPTVETVIYEKGNELTKYNIFVSNFVEQRLELIDVNESPLKDLVRFAMIYAKRNEPAVIDYEGGFQRVSLENVQAIIGKVMVYSIKVEDLSDFAAPPKDGTFDYENEPFYQDGYFYTYAADGEMTSVFAVVDYKEILGDGTYKLNFSIYELSSEKFAEIDYAIYNEWAKYYSMTPAEAAADPDVSKIGVGVAFMSEGETSPILIKYGAVFDN